MSGRRPPTGTGSRRTVPPRLTAEQTARLRTLLEDPDTWVLRSDWEDYLFHGDEATLVATDSLSRDHRTAVISWIEQQRHALYRVLEGGTVAPDGWLEGFALYRRLRDTTRA